MHGARHPSGGGLFNDDIREIDEELYLAVLSAAKGFKDCR